MSNSGQEGLFGHLMTLDGRSFFLERYFFESKFESYSLSRCGQDHIWGEFRDEDLEDKIVHLEDDLPLVLDQAPSLHDTSSLLVAADNATKATYSVMFYYTPTFAALTTDIDGFIDQVPILKSSNHSDCLRQSVLNNCECSILHF